MVLFLMEGTQPPDKSNNKGIMGVSRFDFFIDRIVGGNGSGDKP
jgi:hypothetical protein